MTVTLDGKETFATDIIGRFRQVDLSAGRIAFEPPLAGGRVFVPGKILRADYGAATLAPERTGNETVLELPPVTARQLCIIEVAV